MKLSKKIKIIGFILLICTVGYFGYISISDNSDAPDPVPSDYPSNITESNRSLVDINYASDTLVFISSNNESVDSIYLSPVESDDLFKLSNSGTASTGLSEGDKYGVVVELDGVKYKTETIQPK